MSGSTRGFSALLVIVLKVGCLAPSTVPDRQPVSGVHSNGEPAVRADALARRSTQPPALPAGPLDVNEAVRFATDYHPDVAAARARLEAATGRKVQAGLFPNPTFSAYMESASFSGNTADAEYPIGITQRIPLGGRIGASKAVAEARYQTLYFDFLQKSRELERKVRGAFAAALFARQALAIEQEIAEASIQAAAIARARSAAGDASPAEQARAELEAARARMSVSEAEYSRERTVFELQAVLGGSARVTEIEGDLEAVLFLPELETVVDGLAETPLLRAYDAGIEESEARVLHEEASRVPDIDVGFFYRRVEETNSNAFDVGFAIDLPVFDRRQGSLQEAQARLVESRAQRQSAEVDLATRVKIIHARLRRGLEQARLFREEVSGRSRTVLDAAEGRYQAGETSLVELVPIRRDHRQLELAYLSLLRQIALDWSAFRSLVSPVEGRNGRE